MRSRILLAFVGIPLFVLSGCGSDLAQVEGNVTMNNQPISGVEVSFEPAGPEGGTGMGYTDENGHYTVHFPGRKVGTPPGEYVVRLKGAEVLDGGEKIAIPATYNSQSTLKRTVEPGSNTFDFNIETE